jgi:hypothetical protein
VHDLPSRTNSNGETFDVVGFFKRHYEPEVAPKTKVVLCPGLASMGKGQALAPGRQAHRAAGRRGPPAQTEYQLSADAPGGEEIQRGRFVLSELTAAREFLFDDRVADKRDAQLARVRQANEDTRSTDALALAGALASPRLPRRDRRPR